MYKLLPILLFAVIYTQSQIVAFPGAEGFGAYSKGGMGGEILFVTNLNDYIVQLSNFSSIDHGRFNYKGFTVKKDGKRYNYINSEFEMVQSLKVNSNNPLFNYCSLRKDNKLSVYLYYFYEYNNEFARYNTVVDIFMKELYDTYVKVNIKKELEKKNIPFQLRPLVYELHGIYLKNKQKINLSKVNDYINSLEPDRLTFILKYYL